MARPKRTPIQRENDLRQIVIMHLAGKTQTEIAQHLGLSNQQISYDFAEVRRRWRAETTFSLDEYTNRELARLAVVESEAWQGWKRSQTDRVRHRRLRQDYEIVETEIRDGDAQFLNTVLRCIAERSKMLGLYATTSHAVEVRQDNAPADFSVLTSDELRTYILIHEKALTAQNERD